MLYNSLGGGTGSGLFETILKCYLDSDYKKTPKLGYTVWPSPVMGQSPVEDYNALLAMPFLNDFDNSAFILVDNQALY